MRASKWIAAGAALALMTAFGAAHGQQADPVWLNNYEDARVQAAREHKPLLVLFRCARRVACPEIDAELQHPTDPALAAVLRRYVPVRLSDIRNVDLSRFRFDYDLNFAVLVMNAEGYTYSRFGTRDAEHPKERMSAAGLRQALDEVLADYTKHPAARPAETRPVRLTDYASYRATSLSKMACAHCHYANNYGYYEAIAKDTFDKRALYQYPLPENIGVTLDVRRNNVVQAVLNGSAAQKAGVKLGDTITRAGNSAVHSAADLQFALNYVPEPGRIRLELQRDGKALEPVTLSLPAGWRETDISWRVGQGSVPPIFGFWEQPLTDVEKRDAGVPEDRLALRVTSLFVGEKWAPARGPVQVGDVILGMDGRPLPHMTARQFHTYYRLHHSPGETVTLRVIRSGQRIDLRLQCVDLRVE